MIQASDLRLGNLIYDTEGKVNTVDLTALKYISDYAGIHQARPIPLTEEWLLKLGFEKGNRSGYLVDDPSDISFNYEINGLPFYGGLDFNIKHSVAYFESHLSGSDGDREESITRNVGYVHELQNLYYSLTGNELKVTVNEIELKIKWNETPVIEIIEQDSGKVFRIYHDGRTEGFETGAIVVNRVTTFARTYLVKIKSPE